MDVEFVAYGPVRETLGTKRQTRELPEDATVGDLLSTLGEDHPDLESQLYDDGELASTIALTVDGTNVERLDGLETELTGGETVRVTQPIHGG